MARCTLALRSHRASDDDDGDGDAGGDFPPLDIISGGKFDEGWQRMVMLRTRNTQLSWHKR